MLSELYETMPEAGDLEKPKMVFFFDEAHLIFKDAPRSLLDKVEQIVRLIRSKGIGIYFITQLPSDIPDSVLSQLGNKLQHALRAYTPKDQKALKVAAQSFRPNPKLDAEAALSELGTGEVLVSLLDEEGIPGIVQRAYVMPPRSFLGVAEESKRQEIISASPLHSKYAKTVDRESAYEVLQKRAEQTAKEEAAEAGEEYVPEDETIQEEIRRNSRSTSTSTSTKKTTTTRRTTPKKEKSMLENVAEKAATSFGRSIANALARGILGSLLKK
jgi:DNA helicase HerA-like ATPase